MRINNSDQFIIKGSGKIGIGTTSPSSKLEVKDINHQLRLTDSDDSNKNWTFSSIQSTSGLGFFEDGQNERLVISSGGNVGIGTIQPQRSLVIENPDGANNTVVSIVSGSNIAGSYLDFRCSWRWHWI